MLSDPGNLVKAKLKRGHEERQHQHNRIKNLYGQNLVERGPIRKDPIYFAQTLNPTNPSERVQFKFSD